ncbi:hypothetical protein NGC85_10325 [Acinetobacter sp. Z1]|uniref:hypothetical protein n=1 Tax=Acinetobacter sp. Z1 TaxID=2953738 RepID=UPI0020C8D42B|nr:hypothetical protein [Acinetobacter sp. Z1]UTO18348.1 hypothetical protein NGC85_10325 [Acinetobacter sp. Z1]
MNIVKSKRDLEHVMNQAIRLAIASAIDRIEIEYQEDYQATQYGWFVVLEHTHELNVPIAGLPFSILDKLNASEVEYIEKCPYACEVYITLNDTEGVLIYIPYQIYPNLGIKNT